MTLSVWHDGDDWVIAESAEDATAIWTEYYGEPAEELHWKRWEDSRTLSVFDFDEDGNVQKVMRPCAEWIAKNGRGWLCSVNY